MIIYILSVVLSSITVVSGIQCYSGSQLQVIECPSMNCIKQSLGFDTVRYCDGTGVSSICQTYRIFEACQTIPNLGQICCCADNLCNSSQRVFSSKFSFSALPLLYLLRIALL
ncbi:unnamed protein product [Gongylonema pulchrum]|uniref:Activin_recp domain-containing protein n=1 Tax=Gongylonema pulchrum TaxID=637853 RepID=A0A183CX31_9BILA|nr:unnamed protein product [Gongylonema pulchrum]